MKKRKIRYNKILLLYYILIFKYLTKYIYVYIYFNKRKKKKYNFRKEIIIITMK